MAKWPWIIGGTALLGFALSRKDSVAYIEKSVDYAKFVLGLPSQTRAYAAELYEAGKDYGVDPYLLAGIMWRESLAGVALTPKNDPGGTGDWTTRGTGWTGKYGGVVVDEKDLPAGWIKSSRWGKPYVIPADGKGWGRGLMQIDYGAHHDWIEANRWEEPRVIIRYAAQVLRDNFAFFMKNGLTGDQLKMAAVAAYNLAPSAVLKNVQAGDSPEKSTTGGEYATFVINKASAYQKASGIA